MIIKKHQGINLESFINKASNSGFYADNHKNRKLGRVGQPWKKGEGKEKPKEETKKSEVTSSNYSSYMKSKGYSHRTMIEAAPAFKKASESELDFMLDKYGMGDMKKNSSLGEKSYALMAGMISKHKLSGDKLEVADKLNGLFKEETGNKIDELANESLSSSPDISEAAISGLSNSTVLGAATGDRLDALAKFSEVDIEPGDDDITKRQKIAEKYIELGELEGGPRVLGAYFDEFAEEALSD